MYKAEILADSLSPQGNRLTTMKITFPRFILAEMNTHRMFSRNSASSRAIPFRKMVQMVEENPFIPIAWQKDHKGMQGNEYFAEMVNVETTDLGDLKYAWLEARDYAVKQATWLNKIRVTKQLCNRLLEPFMWHTVIVTATEWENFFALRCPQYHTPVSGEGFYFRSKKDCIDNHSNPENISKLENMTDLEWLEINFSQAEIHIQAIAELMWDAYNESTPKQLQAGEFHLPFGENINLLHSTFDNFKHLDRGLTDEEINQLKLKVSVARCARISYQTLGDNPKIDYEADIKLYNRLLKDRHMSPFEHCARAMSDKEYNSYLKGVIELIDIDEPEYNGGIYEPKFSEKGWCNNFKGFIQYRYLIEENA